jgi:hypothetical protein
MAANWYYTKNRQQMGPVTLEELQRLAGQGLLSPRDLVWQEGMADWTRAGNQGLFPEVMALEASPTQEPITLVPVEEAEDYHPRGRTFRGDDYEDEEYRPRRRRRASRNQGGMPVGLKVGLIVGGLVLFLFGAGIGLFLILRPAANEIAIGMGNFNDFLRPNDQRDPVMGGPSKVYKVHLVQGRTYVIDLKSGQFDAFLRLENSAFQEVAQDDDGGGNLNARIVYRCPNTDDYRIIATGLPGAQGNCRGPYSLSIRENP